MYEMYLLCDIYTCHQFNIREHTPLRTPNDCPCGASPKLCMLYSDVMASINSTFPDIPLNLAHKFVCITFKKMT